MIKRPHNLFYALSSIALVRLAFNHHGKTLSKAQSSSKANELSSGFCNIPHHEKAYRGGEDAWICTDSLVAVADGVGGWNKKGVNPGIFARELCANVLARYSQWTADKRSRY